MPDKKITIQSGQQHKADIDKPTRADNKNSLPDIAEDVKVKAKQRVLVENVWNSNSELNKKLDENILVENRRYVRVRFVEKVICSLTLDDFDGDPKKLCEPIEFLTVDISIGGIGILCEKEISVGKILAFDLVLEQIKYSITCQVAYCIEIEGKFRTGLKIIHADREFLKHLKILVTKLSL